MDDRYFTMSQLWQSLLLTVVIGGLLLAGITYGVLGISERPVVESVQPIATTTPVSTGTLPAAVAGIEASTPGAVVQETLSTVRLSGQAAIVVDLSTGKTLYAQNADTPLPLASLTKLLTLYGAGRVLSPSSIVTISSTSLTADGEYGFADGETFAYSDIAKLALVASSNDAAQAIAEAAEAQSGMGESAFMQNAISNAGLTNTRAANGTGLDIDTTQASAFGTARDMAKLASAFLTNQPTLSRATTRGSASVYSTTGALHTLPNTNPNAARMTGLMLSKTGFTDIAGGNLAVVFDAAIGHPVAVVVLGSTRDGRFTDVERLMRATRLELSKSEAP